MLVEEGPVGEGSCATEMSRWQGPTVAIGSRGGRGIFEDGRAVFSVIRKERVAVADEEGNKVEKDIAEERQTRLDRLSRLLITQRMQIGVGRGRGRGSSRSSADKDANTIRDYSTHTHTATQNIQPPREWEDNGQLLYYNAAGSISTRLATELSQTPNTNL
jgi:hypothetical protein